MPSRNVAERKGSARSRRQLSVHVLRGKVNERENTEDVIKRRNNEKSQVPEKGGEQGRELSLGS